MPTTSRNAGFVKPSSLLHLANNAQTTKVQEVWSALQGIAHLHDVSAVSLAGFVLLTPSVPDPEWSIVESSSSPHGNSAHRQKTRRRTGGWRPGEKGGVKLQSFTSSRCIHGVAVWFRNLVTQLFAIYKYVQVYPPTKFPPQVPVNHPSAHHPPRVSNTL